GGEGRDQLLELGSGRLIPGFEEQLVGAKAGDERLIEVNFPDEYGAEELAGKPATFEVTVSEVKVKRLPELDDDFAADAAGFDTIAELREDIASRLKEYEQQNIEREFERDVLDAVAAGAKIDVPHQLVHARAHEIVHETMDSLARQGISKEMYLQISGQDEEQLAHDAEQEAEQTLRREAAIAAVVGAEKIEPSDEQLIEALQPTAEREKTTPEKLLKQLESNGRVARLRAELANRQAVEWLVEHAKTVAPAKADAAKPAKAGKSPAKQAGDSASKKKSPAKKPAAKKPSKSAD
ncbi:MAG TPA: trigger factor, partial [Solirubrobacteraceae bacterium]|nr:trigger factor [Solirubrobacteraceae bacterium]